MINIDLVQVAILWSIAGLALIGSLNARGFFRGMLSWIITVAIATIAVIFSYAKSVSVKKEMGLDLKAPVHAAESSSSADESVNIVIIEKQLLENAIAISDSILVFPKWKAISAQGIEKREGFESKALSLRNKSMNIYRQIRISSLPSEEEKEYYDLLLAAADNLRLAGYEVHNQFGQEHSDSSVEGPNRAAIYAAQAKATFLQLKEQL
jgi:hypothetical protein